MPGKYHSEKDLLNSEKDYVILRLGSVFGNSFDSTRINIMPNLFSVFHPQMELLSYLRMALS